VSESDRAASNDRDRHERQLQQANDFHGVLLAMAGHDLRQPLQSIVGAYDWLARRLGSSSEQEYLRRGRLALAQLTDQLDLLIEALRMHAHSLDIQPAPVVLGPILVRLCRESKDIAEHEDLTLHANPTRAVAMSDAVLMQGILRNLIRNAVKYTGPGGRVVVGCRRHGTLLKIEVHDNGIGIPPDKLSEIFEAFRRLDSTRADGLGLGLFVVRRAVQLLGHEIEVRSEIGRGSCFSVLAEAADAADSRDRTHFPDSGTRSPEHDVKLAASDPWMARGSRNEFRIETAVG
jgi:signal transduction histidine kinase